MSSALEQWKFRDRLVSAITDDGSYRIAIVQADRVCKVAQEKHVLHPLESLILSELMVCAFLASAHLKGEERIILRLESPIGYVKQALAEVNAVGEARGYIHTRDIIEENMDKQKPLWNSIADCLLHFTKILYNNATPVTGTVEVVNSSLAETLAHYYSISEQTQSAVRISATVDMEFHIQHAMGLLVQKMPNAETRHDEQLEMNILQTPSFTELSSQGYQLDTMLELFLRGYPYKELWRRPIDFFCRCSKEKFMQKLYLLNRNDLVSMQEQGPQELVCQYCSARYIIEGTEFALLIREQDERN